ncbi:hypothetical protein N0P26_000912 [Acinetobacter baumannii]|uniref:hypothetical protein n=1 Tax=Acinetobacter baumannii TaxID=470 RepID=UPI00192ABD4B|nr:hypothetical protein [Acinetobacter baumannii]EKT7958833.1 hypothetical protein [Acinetobacter baumannii]EKT9125763.1 hypothetical protein [Acinetobacter baumannii]EKT9271841.1 hypothetical protein [Acinetobacter baumannii]EKT9313693.1 hypothetical protein [Acinetobacter baumannii]EKU0109409.1 hypothetical protein [Acinetobacter baumannii]
MNEVTVIELSELTGLTRSKIYYLINKGKLIILNGKINLESALQVVTELKIKKTKITNEENFRHILNMLHLQIIALQKQLDLANEREKMYLTELASYRQLLLSKITQNSSTHEIDAQTKLENDVIDRDENSQKTMEFKSENQALLESYQNSNKETKSKNTTTSHSIPRESINNMKLELTHLQFTEQNETIPASEITPVSSHEERDINKLLVMEPDDLQTEENPLTPEDSEKVVLTKPITPAKVVSLGHAKPIPVTPGMFKRKRRHQ